MAKEVISIGYLFNRGTVLVVPRGWTLLDQKQWPPSEDPAHLPMRETKKGMLGPHSHSEMQEELPLWQSRKEPDWHP